MPADTSVKFFHSAMAGAPVLSGTAGSLIAVLDACLVNGFGVSSVNSLVVAGAVATATMSAGHSAEVGSVVLVSGATPSGLNGEKKVLSVGAGNTTLTFDATGISDQTASGTITLKLSPAGWSKAYSGTNLAAYKSPDVAATGCYLRIDDTSAKTARAQGYESMTGISAGTGPFPTAAQLSGGVYWTKSSVADSSSRSWTLVADGRMFYLQTRYQSGANGGGLVAFGDLVPFKSGDAWSCVLSGYFSDLSGSNPGILDDYANNSTTVGQLYLPRPYTGVGSAIWGQKGFGIPQPTSKASFASGSGPVKYPNGPDNGLYLSSHFVSDSADLSLRGVSPGLYCSPQLIPSGWASPHYSITGVSALPGRLIKVEPYGAATGDLCGFAFFDVTGPWR